MTAPVADGLPYGVRDLKLTQYLDALGMVLGPTSVDLPYIQTLNFTEAEEFSELRGDDKLITTRGRGSSFRLRQLRLLRGFGLMARSFRIPVATFWFAFIAAAQTEIFLRTSPMVSSRLLRLPVSVTRFWTIRTICCIRSSVVSPLLR